MQFVRLIFSSVVLQLNLLVFLDHINVWMIAFVFADAVVGTIHVRHEILSSYAKLVPVALLVK